MSLDLDLASKKYVKYYTKGKMVVAFEEGHDEGCTERDNEYRDRLIARVLKKETDKSNPKHPIFHGIVMSAHHLISIQGFNKSKLNAKDIEYKGYNINALVAYKLNLAEERIEKCDDTPDSTLVELIKVMNRISASMVHDISFIDDEFPDIYLSSVGANFVNGNPVGCANGLNISDIKENMLADAKCNCINRDHQYSVSKQKTKRGYKITYPKQNYQLEEGL